MTRIAFDVTSSFHAELERILSVTDIASRPDLFRHAFTLLRIHVEAAERGQKIRLVDEREPDVARIITLPFNVNVP